MTPVEIEEEVFATEGVRVVIRANRRTQLGDYQYDRMAANNSTIKEWLDRRVIPIIEGNEVVVINGEGVRPNGQMSLARLRASYRRD
jgi:glutamate 5-kinase